MKNFGFKKLILINPVCNPKSITARKRSKHAVDVLNNSKIISLKSKKEIYSVMNKFDYTIATTSQLGTDFNIARSPITPEQLLNKLSNDKINITKTKIALVFGRENYGLSNEEINACDFSLTIPTNKEYPSMNISHSIAVVLYELSKLNDNQKENKVNSHIL